MGLALAGRRTRRSVVTALTCAVAVLPGCAQQSTAPRTAVPDLALDRRWQHAGDTATPGEWSGADGTGSVPLPGGRIAWFFSDTYVGPVGPDGSWGQGTPTVHNSLVVQDGDRLTTVASGTPVRPPAGLPGWYWVGAGTVEGGMLVEFYHRFVGSGPWNFTEQATAVATFSLPDLRLRYVQELPTAPVPPGGSPVMWGSALLRVGEWTYVYGYRAHLDQPGNPKHLYVARVPHDRLLDPTAWQYDAGSGWSADPERAREYTTPVDAGFGLLPLPGHGYALVTRQPSATLSENALIAYLAPTPTGPFTPSDTALLYRTPEAGSGRYVYEARVHPELGDDGTTVISYNVNSACRIASIYRPRFVRVPLTIFRPGYRAPSTKGLTSGLRAC